MLIALSNDFISIFNTETFKLIKQINESNQQKCIFSEDNKQLITFSNKICKAYNVEKDFELIKSFEEHNSQITVIAFS